MSSVTLDHVLLSTLLALMGFFLWVGKRYIERADVRWERVEASIEEVKAQRVVCVADFARQSDMNTVYGTLRKHGERLSSLEALAHRTDVV